MSVHICINNVSFVLQIEFVRQRNLHQLKSLASMKLHRKHLIYCKHHSLSFSQEKSVNNSRKKKKRKKLNIFDPFPLSEFRHDQHAFLQTQSTYQWKKLIMQFHLILQNIFQQFLLFLSHNMQREKKHFNILTVMHTNQKEAHITFVMLLCPLQMDNIFFSFSCLLRIRVQRKEGRLFYYSTKSVCTLCQQQSFQLSTCVTNFPIQKLIYHRVTTVDGRIHLVCSL